MRELIRRLAAQPLLATELVAATLLINILGLASTVYIIQVMNRYISYGVESTLIVMTVGVLIAILFEYLINRIRFSLAGQLGRERNGRLRLSSLGHLCDTTVQAVRESGLETRLDIRRLLDQIDEGYSATQVTTWLDLPFALLYLVVIFLLSVLIGWLVTLFLLFLMLMTFLQQEQLGQRRQRYHRSASSSTGVIRVVHGDPESVRMFDRSGLLMRQWERISQQTMSGREMLEALIGQLQISSNSIRMLLSVMIYAVGSREAVLGTIDIGVLIASNVLAMRALAPVQRLPRLIEGFEAAREGLEGVKRISALPGVYGVGFHPTGFSGKIELRGCQVSYQSDQPPLFESLDLLLQPGEVLVVTGNNGSGKTTVARLIAGLLSPTVGQVLVDGVVLRQLDLAWWRNQILYLPQDVSFFNGTLRDNFVAANPALERDEERIRSILQGVGLGKMIAESPEGVDRPVREQGFSFGVRKRLGLARALLSDGQLVLFDDPMEGLDLEGRRVLYRYLHQLASEKRTMIIMTDDPAIIKGATIIVNLNSKPVPKVQRVVHE